MPRKARWTAGTRRRGTVPPSWSARARPDAPAAGPIAPAWAGRRGGVALMTVACGGEPADPCPLAGCVLSLSRSVLGVDVPSRGVSHRPFGTRPCRARHDRCLGRLAPARRDRSLPGRQLQLLAAPFRHVLAPRRRRRLAGLRHGSKLARPGGEAVCLASGGPAGENRAPRAPDEDAWLRSRPAARPDLLAGRLRQRPNHLGHLRARLPHGLRAQRPRVGEGGRRGRVRARARPLRTGARDRPRRPARAGRLERHGQPVPGAGGRAAWLPGEGPAREPPARPRLRRQAVARLRAAGNRPRLGDAVPEGVRRATLTPLEQVTGAACLTRGVPQKVSDSTACRARRMSGSTAKKLATVIARQPSTAACRRSSRGGCPPAGASCSEPGGRMYTARTSPR